MAAGQISRPGIAKRPARHRPQRPQGAPGHGHETSVSPGRCISRWDFNEEVSGLPQIFEKHSGFFIVLSDGYQALIVFLPASIVYLNKLN
jgi:hypothetical protein